MMLHVFFATVSDYIGMLYYINPHYAISSVI